MCPCVLGLVLYLFLGLSLGVVFGCVVGFAIVCLGMTFGLQVCVGSVVVCEFGFACGCGFGFAIVF